MSIGANIPGNPLLNQAMKDFVILNKLVVDSGVPGVPSTVYQEGATIKGVASMKTSTEMDIAQQQGAKRVYAFYFLPAVEVIDQGTIIKRMEDGLTFRVSTAPQMKTPSFSSIPLKYTTMEVIALDR